METSSSKVEAMMKPVLFKAGFPLAVSAAAFVLARIATRKSPAPEIQPNLQETGSCDQESCHSLDSGCLPQVEDDDREEILMMRRRIEDMEDRELQLERRFLYYQGLKDHEVVLMELHNKMVVEMNRVEFLEREVSLVEAESQRFYDAANEYLRLLRLDELLRSENEQLRRSCTKLLRRTKEHYRILRKQRLQIQCKETEISRNKEELEEKDDFIKLMQDEIKELKLIIEQLSHKLRSEEESTASKNTELTYLRWSNACLKHELMRKSQEEHVNFGGMEEFGSDNEIDRRVVEQGVSYFGLEDRDQAHSRRRRLVAKFKRWVEGSEKSKQMRLDVKERHGNRCFPRHSVSDEGPADDACLPARKSCSSA